MPVNWTPFGFDGLCSVFESFTVHVPADSVFVFSANVRSLIVFSSIVKRVSSNAKPSSHVAYAVAVPKRRSRKNNPPLPTHRKRADALLAGKRSRLRVCRGRQEKPGRKLITEIHNVLAVSSPGGRVRTVGLSSRPCHVTFSRPNGRSKTENTAYSVRTLLTEFPKSPSTHSVFSVNPSSCFCTLKWPGVPPPLFPKPIDVHTTRSYVRNIHRRYETYEIRV